MTAFGADTYFLFFGWNESFAGPAGIEKFKADYEKFLDEFAKKMQETDYFGNGMYMTSVLEKGKLTDGLYVLGKFKVGKDGKESKYTGFAIIRDFDGYQLIFESSREYGAPPTAPTPPAMIVQSFNVGGDLGTGEYFDLFMGAGGYGMFNACFNSPGSGAVNVSSGWQYTAFPDEYEAEVWYKMMEPRLRRAVQDRDERILILKQVFCEAHRAGEVRLPPGLVMAIIDVESRFNRWAVSPAGAVGLMQVMPFWPEQLGMRRYQLVRVAENIRMGAAIFRFYLKRERNDVARALARYNGSVGRRFYSDMVIQRWTRWNGADDLGLRPGQPVLKPAGG